LQRLKYRLITISSHSGPKAVVTDALSRNRVSNLLIEEYDSQYNPEVLIAEIRALSSLELLSTTCLQELHDNAANHPEYQQPREIILNGFTDHRQQFPEPC